MNFDSPKDRLILPIDGMSVGQAGDVVEEMAGHVGIFKIGLEMIFRAVAAVFWYGKIPDDEAVFGVMPIARLLQTIGARRMFLDAKLHDIDNTVGEAFKQILGGMNPHIVNVHSTGGFGAMSILKDLRRIYGAAIGYGANSPETILVAVTLLTSLSVADLIDMGLLPADGQAADLENIVGKLAKLVIAAGLDGIICAPPDVARLRAEGFPGLIITPGVRPSWAAANDQKRIMTPRQAIAAGADMIVVGRPITKPPDGMTPTQAAGRVLEEIEQGLTDRAR